MDGITALQRRMAYLGLIIATFASYFVIAGSGVFVYAAAFELSGTAFLALLFTIENLFRGCMVPLSGRLGDKIGRKKLFLAAAAGYMVSSALCACSNSITMFVVGRALMGMTWGLFFANLMVMVTDLYDESESPKLTGYMMSVSFVSMLISGTLCGLLVDTISWRAIFFIIIPMIALAWILIAAFMPKNCQATQNQIQLDGVGVVLTMASFGPLVLLLNFAGSVFPWVSVETAVIVAIVVVSVALLVHNERKVPDPIFPPSIIAHKACIFCFGMAVLFAVATTVGNYLPTFAQSILGFNATIAGSLSIPSLVVSIIGSSLLGKYIAKKGVYKRVMLLWAFATLAASILFGLFSGVTPIWFILITTATMGLGQMSQQVVPFTFPTSVLPKELIAPGIAFMSFGQQLGTATANAIYGAASNALGFMGMFQVPLVAAVIMVILALLFKDSAKKTNAAAPIEKG